MKLALKTAVFNRRLGENTVAWTISWQGHQYGEFEGRINQYVVVNLHREFRYGVTTADKGLAIKTQISSSSVWSTVLNKPGNCLLSCHVYLINMR